MGDNKRTATQLRRSVHQCLEDYPYGIASAAQSNLQASCKNSLSFVQRLGLLQTLYVHNGCVNTVNWNASGTLIVSGSDDNHLVVTDAHSGRVLARSKTQHKHHIFSARFMPHSNDSAIVSCSGEGLVMHTEFLTEYRRSARASEKADCCLIGENDRTTNSFDCHKFGSTFDVLPLPDTPRSFLSCGEDATVRCFDLRVSSSCSERACQKHVFITAPCAVTAMDVAPVSHHSVAIGCSDSIVRLYDRRMLAGGASDSTMMPYKAYPIPMEYTRRHYRPTCVKFSPDESELLVSYSMEQVYLFDLKHPGYSDAELLKSGCYTPKMRRDDDPEPQMPRLRFRGDWSDTGPNSLSAGVQGVNQTNIGQARPALEPGVLSRLSDEIFRLLNSPSQRRQASAVAAQPDQPEAAPQAPASAPAGASAGNSNGHRNGPRSWQNAVLRTMANASAATGRSPDSQSSEGEALQFPIKKFDYVKMSFSGHRNSRTMVKGASFWGDDFIMSGSDCGHIFVWNRATGKVVKTLLADNRVVNRVQPHPTLPYLLSSGIDYNVKLWAPIAPEPQFDEVECAGLIKSNEIMLVETRDTITVPAQIMIRILASLHHAAGSESRSRAAAAPASSP
ncbi:hypothetical protein KR054_009978 [Drosophila jambulina]|nr:hypothetical protein KR054_009978 [Drosophila jambulina]